MATFTYPSAAELVEIAQDKMPRLIQDRVIFQLAPVREVDAPLIMWEQQDNFRGLQQVRGLDGAPRRVKKVGVKRYQMEPGYYGEVEEINETDLTLRRVPGTFGTPINIDDLVMQAQDKLLLRRLDRIEKILWDLFLTGTFSVSNGSGVVEHTDSYTLQSFAAIVPWSTPGTSTPMGDLRSIQLKRRGHSVDFGRKAKMYINRKTLNDMLSNSNAADIYGRRTGQSSTPSGPVGGTLNTLDEMNKVFLDQDLPEVVCYDEGYLSDGTDGNAVDSYQLFIPNGEGVVVGARPAGQVVAEYRMTRNANNPDMAPGPYMRVIDDGERKIPRSIQVHDGHNGGPALYFGSAIVKVSGL